MAIPNIPAPPVPPSDFYHQLNGFDIPNVPNPTKFTPTLLKDKLLQPALTSHFQCWFYPTQDVKNWNTSRGFNFDQNGNSEFISLSCSEASLPGSSLATNEINDDYTGVTERHAYRRQYDDRADFTFYVDHARKEGSYNIIWFFENWISYIVNERRTLIEEANGTLIGGINNKRFSYRVNYPNTYQSVVYINKFEKDHKDKYLRYTFLQAYPISINSMPVSYESSQLLKCTVSFTYTRYIINKVKAK